MREFCSRAQCLQLCCKALIVQRDMCGSETLELNTGVEGDAGNPQQKFSSVTAAMCPTSVRRVLLDYQFRLGGLPIV
jgi:hypothetical protein